MSGFSSVSDLAAALGTDIRDLIRIASGSLQPPVGQTIATTGFVSSTSAAATAKTQHFYPLDIGPAGWTADAIYLNQVTAYSGSTIPTYFLGLYPTLPASGFPDTSKLLSSASISAGSAAGILKPVLANPVPMNIGRYWASFLMAGDAVATAGSLTTILSAASYPALPMVTAVAPGTNIRSLTLTGQSALATAATAPNGFGVNGGSSAPALQVRRSA